MKLTLFIIIFTCSLKLIADSEKPMAKVFNSKTRMHLVLVDVEKVSRSN